MGEGGEFFEVPHLSLCQGCSHLLTTSASLLAKVRKGSSLQSSFPPHPPKKKEIMQFLSIKQPYLCPTDT